MPTSEALQVWYGTLPVICAILLANWDNNKRLEELSKRIDDLRTSMAGRIHDLKAEMTTGFSAVKSALAKLESRVGDLEKGTKLVRS